MNRSYIGVHEATTNYQAVEGAINIVKRNPNVLVNFPNTIGLKSYMIRKFPENAQIRIAGAYDEDRLRRYKGVVFKPSNETAYDLFYNSVIYSRNELIKILEAMEKIESGINYNWSPFQKLLYIYDILKREIMYDPKYKMKDSSDTRSLRGLMTKTTVCAGFAVIFKELLNRQNIKCDFVMGNGHAWNVVTIDGRMYPFDLTYANTNFRMGKYTAHDFIAQDVEQFNKTHKADSKEPLYGQEHRFCSIDPKTIDNILAVFSRKREYKTTVYTARRNDGTRFVIAQLGPGEINGKTYYRYCYFDILTNGTMTNPLLFYSLSNISKLVEAKKFNQTVPAGYENALVEILFSKENIRDSINRNTGYIGSVYNPGVGNHKQMIRSVRDIQKPYDMLHIYNKQTRIFRRSDNTYFVAEKLTDRPHNIEGYSVNSYRILELIRENGEYVVKAYRIFTELDLLSIQLDDIPNIFLSRERLERKMRQAGGYMGFMTANGECRYHDGLVRFFETSKRVDLTPDSIKRR